MKSLNLEIGNQVSLIDQDIKGIILKINGNLITLLNSDGLEMTYHKKELIKIEETPYIKKLYQEYIPFLSKTSIPKPKPLHYQKKKTSTLKFDLHIEKLTQESHNLKRHQIIDRQLEIARDALEILISNRIYKKLILIHGNGKKVLREKIYLLIEKKYPELEYFDASYQKYGTGATEIRFK